MYKYKIDDPVSYLTTITFSDGVTFILKGKAKTTASLMIQSPRTMKKIYEHLDLSTQKDINMFNCDTHQVWHTYSDGDPHFSKYSVHKSANNELIFTVECTTKPISA